MADLSSSLRPGLSSYGQHYVPVVPDDIVRILEMPNDVRLESPQGLFELLLIIEEERGIMMILSLRDELPQFSPSFVLEVMGKF